MTTDRIRTSSANVISYIIIQSEQRRYYKRRSGLNQRQKHMREIDLSSSLNKPRGDLRNLTGQLDYLTLFLELLRRISARDAAKTNSDGDRRATTGIDFSAPATCSAPGSI